MTASARCGRGEGSVYRDAANGTRVGATVDDWTAEVLGGLADKAVRSHADLLRPVTMLIGERSAAGPGRRAAGKRIGLHVCLPSGKVSG
jgi:hypothetical protein